MRLRCSRRPPTLSISVGAMLLMLPSPLHRTTRYIVWEFLRLQLSGSYYGVKAQTLFATSRLPPGWPWCWPCSGYSFYGEAHRNNWYSDFCLPLCRL